MSISSYFLVGGGFQDGNGEPLSDGTLRVELYPVPATKLADPGISADAGTLGVCNGQTLEYPLDESGDVITSPRQCIIPTNLLQSMSGAASSLSGSGFFYAL